MTSREVIDLPSPAKVNLGLEILGKRPDGYHEIRTVMARLSLCDRLHVGDDPRQLPPASSLDGIERNLVDIALARYREHAPDTPALAWSLEKRIPVAAGLGGASSNAATALVAANRLAGNRLPQARLEAIAATIGSDVPFFLGPPVALASGRGVDLKPVSAAAVDLLLIVPNLRISGKTAVLYGLLTPSDFSDGSTVAETACMMANPASIERSGLRNAFSRALCTVDSRIGTLQHVLDDMQVTWALSGAGPCHYVLTGDADGQAVIAELSERFGDWLTFHPVRTIASRPDR